VTQASENPFWNFSLSVYGRDGVPDACLRLQDRLGVDVNVLLYCCWVAECGYAAMDEPALQRVLDLVAPWKAEIVAPLRAVRRAMKGKYDGFEPVRQETLRGTVKRIELDAERLQQDALFNATDLPDFPKMDSMSGAELAAMNVERYMKTLENAIDGGARDDIAYVIGAAFADTA
jgi:uncharacterized protein (TIGR02444 family)